MVAVHSEIESYRRVLKFHTPEGEASTVLVMRRRDGVWLTFNGAVKTTVVMRDHEAGHLIEAVTGAAASSPP